MTLSRYHPLLFLCLLFLLSSKCTTDDDVNIDDSSDDELTIDTVSTIFLDGQQFTMGIEGPAVDQNLNLFAVNHSSEGTIGQVTSAGVTSTFLTLPSGSIGNGIRFFDTEMYVADYAGHKVYKIQPDGQWEVYAENTNMNQPNDLTIAQTGQIFCSDPNWNTGNGGIWTISPDDQQLVQIQSNLGLTNGIELSPNDDYLYVSESNKARILRYSINWNTAPVSLEDGMIFHSFADGDVDGIRCDQDGNLYVARITAQEVAILSPEGDEFHTVKLIGQNPTNVAFGGTDGKTVYVTVKDTRNIEQFRTISPGRAMLMH